MPALPYPKFGSPSRRLGLGILTGIAGLYAASLSAQTTAFRPIDPSAQFPHQLAPPTDAGAVANETPKAVAPAVAAGPTVSFTLADVTIVGADSIDKEQLAAIWQPSRGKTVTNRDIAAMGTAIAQSYADAGYELVSVQVPDQTYAGGKAVIVVTEGHVGAITIEGNTADSDITLLKNYAARIVADRPLHKATLERYILLMNDIPGLKVGSRFEALAGDPGGVRLVLSIIQKQFEWGAQVNNLGTNALGNTQATLVGAIDNLLQEGDQTQLTVGVPAEFRRYQYVGLSQREPIGMDGAYLSLGAGYLHTNPADAPLAGEAVIANAVFNYPIVRAVHENLIGSFGVDMLNSDSALLGMSLANERTRSLRLSAIYVFDDSWRGSNTVSATLSQGIAGLGARRGNIAYGGPTYTKFSGLLTREQLLPWYEIILRAKVQGQYAPNHLPNSEQYLYGGPYIGRGFDTAFLSGDRGVGIDFEVAHALPGSWTPDFLTGSEAFTFIDWGEAVNVGTHYQLPYAHAASAGAGVRFKLLEKATVELAGAYVVNQPSQYAQVESPRFIFGFTRTF
jgi:hemolysin activation/secretion protein